MDLDLINRLQYSYSAQPDVHSLPSPLSDSLKIISGFFEKNSTNKLCLVFPTKELSAQWLSVPLVLNQVNGDFTENENEIFESYKSFKPGDKLLLNNEAVVQWKGLKEIEKKGVKKKVGIFLTKSTKNSPSYEIAISIDKIIKLQKTNREKLSPQEKVRNALPKKTISPIERLLDIETYGNQNFIVNKICLVTKYKSFDASVSNIKINNSSPEEYIAVSKIDNNGTSDVNSPLLIVNNLSNLALYLITNPINKIIIDGYSAILDRGVDFNDIDVKKIPTILITDLSEMRNFENIGEYGFDFYNFTKETLQLDETKKVSPFSTFDRKLHNYVSFKLEKEDCENTDIENIAKLIHSIDKDESAKELVNMEILLIQLLNLVSRIAHPLNKSEVAVYKGMLSKIETLLFENRFYFGGSLKAIEDSISLLKSVIEKFGITPSEKCEKLSELMKENQYDYIICTTEDEALSLSLHLNSLRLAHKPNVISVANVNNSLLDHKPVKAILTGWAKTNNVNSLLSSFLFSDLTVLFYRFESKYFNSLQNRNKRFSGYIKSTINKIGIRSETETENENGFAELYTSASKEEADPNFDILEFELKLDNAQFSKYIVRGNLADSVKAKRAEFKNDKFIYLTDTHGLLVLENFQQATSKSLYIHKSRVESLHHGDVIAFLKTERELLNKIVGKQTTPAALAETTKWIELWKHLLRNHYQLLNNDFNRLVSQLKERGCNRDPVTIHSWLFDDLRIGPRKDDDLISIAIMTNGTELYNNIQQVRNAIKQMTSWRMKASDFLIEQLKAKIKSTYSTIQVNNVIDFEDLGEVEILELTEINNSYQNIDIRNVNRLLEKAKL